MDGLFPKVSIVRIDISGFMCVEKAITLSLSGSNNVIDGPANELKNAIVKAFDFMLNRSLAKERLAMSCLNGKLRPDSTEAYVRICLNGSQKFCLNSTMQKNFVLTRYIDKERIGYIFHGSMKKQKITEFHDQMDAIKYLRIDDLIIGNHMAPSGSQMNHLYCQAIGFYTAYQSLKQLNLENKRIADELGNFYLLLRHMHNDNSEIGECLSSIRFLQYGINQCKLDKILAECDDWDGLPKKRDDIVIQVREMELSKCFRTNLTSRSKRIDNFTKNTVRFTDRLLKDTTKTSDLKKAFIEVKKLFAEMGEALKQYATDLHKRSEQELAQFEYHEMLTMYRRLKYHDEDLPKHIEDCEYGLKALNETKERHFDGKLAEKMKTNIKHLHASSESDLETLQTKLRPIQKLYNRWNEDGYEEFKVQRDLIISMNESDVLRFKVDTFCFRQNHFNPGEIESVRIGFLMLWRNKTLAKHFCGQIGDFINANGDENVLRISLPILTSRFYCTFLFRTKPKADEFLEMAKAFKDIGGRGIKAMSIDELQNRPKLPFASLAGLIMVKPVNNRALAEFVQGFFDQFRWANSTIDPKTVAKKSKSMKIRIFHNDEYYDETGATGYIYQGRKTADLKAFISDWEEMAKHRDAVCGKMYIKEELENAAQARTAILTDTTAELTELRKQIVVLTKGIYKKVANIAGLEYQIDKNFVDSEKHNTLIHVLIKKKEFLEAHDFQPKFEMPEPEYVSLATVIKNPVLDALKVFAQACADLDIFPSTFEANLDGYRDLCYFPKVQGDYEIVPPVKPFDEAESMALGERCDEYNRKFAMFAETLNLRDAQNELNNASNPIPAQHLQRIETMTLEELEHELEETIESIPKNVKMLDPVKNRSHYDAVVGQMEEEYWATARQIHFSLTNEAGDEYDRIIHRSFFIGLHGILHQMNTTEFLLKIGVNPEHLTFRLKLCRGEQEVIISPGTIYEDNWLNVIPCKALAESTADLTFWYCDENDVFIACDAVDPMEQSNIYAIIFHMLLTSMLNFSTIVFNNTVQARSADDIEKCLDLHSEWIDDGLWNNERGTKQIIVVDHNAYSDAPFFDGRFKHITCKQQNDRQNFQILTEN